MTSYQVGFPSASVQKHFEKELVDVDGKTQRRIKDAVENLSADPRPPGKQFKFLSPPIAVYQFVARYRLRVGDYRILYDVDDQLRKVILLSVRRRSEKTYR